MDTNREPSDSRQTAKASQEQRELLRVTLSSVGDAVITTDKELSVTFLNPVAETLTGWTQEEATGVPLERVFKTVNEETRRTVENAATRALREGVIVDPGDHTLLIAQDGTERTIANSAAPIRNASKESPASFWSFETDEGGHVWLTMQQEDDEVEVRVRDTGLGIAPELLPRIFDLFLDRRDDSHRRRG